MFLLKEIIIILGETIPITLNTFNKEIKKGNISKATTIIEELKEKNKTKIIEITYAEFLLKTGEYEKLIKLYENNPLINSIIMRAKFNLKKLKEKKYKLLLNSSPFCKEILKKYIFNSLNNNQINEADRILEKIPLEYKETNWYKEYNLISNLLKLNFTNKNKEIMKKLLINNKFIKTYERMINRVLNISNNSLNKIKEDTFKLKEFTNRLENLNNDSKQKLFNINIYKPLYIKMLTILITYHKFPEYASFIEKILKETGDMNYRKLHIKYLVYKNQNEEALKLLNEYNIKDPSFKEEIQLNIKREKDKLNELRNKEIKERKSKNPIDHKGYYKILGCNPWDPQEIIKENYRKKLKNMKNIEDLKQRNNETMKLTQAFDALKTETNREEYDKGKNNYYGGYNNYKNGQSNGGFDDIFNEMFGGSRRQTRSRTTYFRFG